MQIFTAKDKKTIVGRKIFRPAEPFVCFVPSFENTCALMIWATTRLSGSVIPAKAGIQVNSAQNKPGFRLRGNNKLG